MPVILDSAASNQQYVISATSGSLSWTHHVNPNATNTQAFVALEYAGFASISSGTFTATFGGVAMTQIAQTSWSNATVILFQLASPAPGASTVRVAYSGVTSSIQPGGFLGVSTTYANVASVGSPVVATPTGTSNSSVVGTARFNADRIMFVHGVGIGFGFSTYNQTLRARANKFNGGDLLMGDAQGNTTVTSTERMTGSTSSWAAFAVPMQPTVVTADFTGSQFGPQSATFRGSIYRVSVPPPWRTWLAPPLQNLLQDQKPFKTVRFDQDPQAVLDYGGDFSAWLPPGDTLVDAVFTANSDDVRIFSTNITDTTAVCWVEFSPSVVPGDTYWINCHPTSYGGRQDDRAFQVRCKEASYTS